MKKILLPLVLSLLTLSSVRADLIWYEGFDYVDGPINVVGTNIDGSTNWFNYSGSSDAMVVNHKLENAASSGTLGRSGDNYRPLCTNSCSYTSAPTVLYFSFTVNSTNFADADGGYFAHLAPGGGSFTYQCRVFTLKSPTGLPNTWQLGVSGGGGTATAVYPVDLATNVDYQVVVEWDPVSLFAASLWVNPISSLDPKVISNDAITPITAGTFNFRQAGSMGNWFCTISNLAIATSFEEAATNVWATNATTPAIVYSPTGGTNFSGQPFMLSGVAAGQGLGSLTYTWLKDGAPYSNPDGNTNVLNFFSGISSDSGDYQLVAQTPFGLSATSAVASVWVTNAPVPPTIVSQPASTNVYFGQTATLSIEATGPGTITYNWYYNDSPVSSPNVVGDGTPMLTISDVQTNNGTTGTYHCAVSNVYGGLLSFDAELTVSAVPTVSIAYLRTLVDPTTYLATNSTQLWQAVGTVTIATNLTSGDTASYYLQDSTAGINIFATFASTFRPQQGDVVAFVGVLSSFNSTLELLANTTTIPLSSYTVLSNDINTLPAPMSIPFSITNDLAQSEAIEGSVVMITNVYFGASAGTTISTNANTTVTVTNAAGEPMLVFFSFQDTDTAGMTLPSSAVTIVGPFTQNLPNATTPRNQGYSVTVTRFSDIVTNPLSASITYAGGSSTLSWDAAPVSYPYTVLSATAVTGPYTALTNNLRFTDPSGAFTDPNAGGSQKYYQLSTP